MDSQENRLNSKNEFDAKIYTRPPRRGLSAAVNEGENEYIVNIQLVGFDKDEVLIYVEGDILFVEAKREDILDEENSEYYLEEHSFAYCQRSFSLDGIDKKS